MRGAEMLNPCPFLTWLLCTGGRLHYFEDRTRGLRLALGGVRVSRRSYGVVGSSRTSGALDNLDWSSVSHKCRIWVWEGRRGYLGSYTRGGGHCQCGHRPTVLACCLTHNNLHDARAAHHGGGCE